MIADTLNEQLLGDFFDSWTRLCLPNTLEFKLERFFLAFNDLLPITPSEAEVKYSPGEKLELERLKEFFCVLPNHMNAARQSGLLCDLWAVASLKRDEVRNSAVLAWLLDPRGSHGFGSTLLERLLQSFRGALPDRIGERCTVRVESCPDGDGKNRVDIEIDDPKFFLIIEVKIGASEGVEQLNRYCELAEAKAKSGGKQWAVVFLTPTGRVSATTLSQPEKVISKSWKEIAVHLDALVRENSRSALFAKSPESYLTTLMARQFSKHVRSF